MEIYISEKDMPKSCYGCVCYDGENGRCKVLDTYLEGEHIPRICPLKSLEQHDNFIRHEFADKVRTILLTKATDGYYFATKISNLLKQYEVEE